MVLEIEGEKKRVSVGRLFGTFLCCFGGGGRVQKQIMKKKKVAQRTRKYIYGIREREREKKAAKVVALVII